MKYVVASTAVTDEVRQPDGKSIREAIGGAGIYALCGIKLWCDEVLLATGVGTDFADMYGEWFKKNHLSMEGLLVKQEKTPHTVVQYFENGEREETPLYGLKHYQETEITAKELKLYFKTAKGIYIFKNSQQDFWENILEYKKSSETRVMWEIGADAVDAANRGTVRAIAEKLDVFSINLTESKRLLDETEIHKIAEEYQRWKIPLVFLRMGQKGALMITPNRIYPVPAEENIVVTDPTGGGNSSSGAVLYGYCEGYSPEVCGRMGSISAAMCLAQFGVPERILPEMRRGFTREISNDQ